MRSGRAAAVAAVGRRRHGVAAEVAVEIERELGERAPPLVVVPWFPRRDDSRLILPVAAEDAERGSWVSGHVIADDHERPPSQMHVALTGPGYGTPVRDGGQAEQDVQAHPRAPAS